MFIITIVFIIIFCIYMFLNEGYIYIASKHFEKEISITKIKNNHKQKNVLKKCTVCGVVLKNEENSVCSNCINKQVNTYSNSSEFKTTEKKQNIKRNY